MRDGGRIAAAIQVLGDVLNRHQPVKTAVRDWGKRARYAGSKDRAWVSGLVLDSLRKRNSLAAMMSDPSPRGLVLGALKRSWDWDLRRIDSAMDEPHAPAKLTMEERERLAMAPDVEAASHVQGDFPDWLTPQLERAFGENIIIETQAMTVRAGVDLRVNSIKANMEKAGAALRSVNAETSPLIDGAFHIPAADPTARDAALDRIPAYSKGWVEVQDAGSQIAAALANVQPGEQVLDYCAGGGGKTLAFAAAMQGKGQVFAYDIDGRRLSAIIPRLKRSGAHNVQMLHPDETDVLTPHKDMMDCVFVDAPCSGTGTWRRRPDTKWRLKPKSLETRIAQQNEVLRAAAEFVKPGGRLIFVTCSFLIEEGEDRVSEFLSDRTDFKAEPIGGQSGTNPALTDYGKRVIEGAKTRLGGVRLTPHRSQTDGFFISVLRRTG